MTGPWRKSSRSNTSGGQCVEWRKSSHSNASGGQCVEARTLSGRFEVRDSKLGDGSPILGVPRTEFGALIATLKSGQLDY